MTIQAYNGKSDTVTYSAASVGGGPVRHDDERDGAVRRDAVCSTDRGERLYTLHKEIGGPLPSEALVPIGT
jgi:hypothetical protein